MKKILTAGVYDPRLSRIKTPAVADSLLISSGLARQSHTQAGLVLIIRRSNGQHYDVL